MNRQTLAVIFGTVALVVLGIVLLYATPAPTPATPASGGPGKATKAKPTGDRLPPARLVHKQPIPEDRVAAPAGAPNVVVIFTSSQRRDQWTSYDGPSNTAAWLAERAKEGVLVLDGLTVSPEPHAAAAALTTGRYPHKVGAVELSEKRNTGPLASSAATLAERFAEAGWFTAGVSANHHYNKRMGQSQGFDWYRDSQPFSLMLEQRTSAAEVVAFALKRVEQRTDDEKARPLYLQLALVDSHKPFRIPPTEFRPFEGPSHAIAPYRATIKRLDDAVERLTVGLGNAGLSAENTVFVVVADHGEGLEMPPHHRKQHGFVLYESAIRVPWIMWGAGVPVGVELTGLASTIDVAPTVVSLAGLEGADFDGIDLAKALKTGVSPRTEAYADTNYEGVHRASVWTTTRQCQKDYDSKEIEADAFKDACFDRIEDPTFTRAIPDDALMSRVDALHAELIGAAEAP